MICCGLLLGPQTFTRAIFLSLPREAIRGHDSCWLALFFHHTVSPPSPLHPLLQPAATRSRHHEHHSPMTLHRRRRLVVSPSPLSLGLSVHEGGSGIRSPMGRWNFRRLGSTVTMGLNVAWFPRSLVTSSSGTGWACRMAKTEGSAPGQPAASQIGSARHTRR